MGLEDVCLLRATRVTVHSGRPGSGKPPGSKPVLTAVPTAPFPASVPTLPASPGLLAGRHFTRPRALTGTELGRSVTCPFEQVAQSWASRSGQVKQANALRLEHSTHVSNVTSGPCGSVNGDIPGVLLTV